MIDFDAITNMAMRSISLGLAIYPEDMSFQSERNLDRLCQISGLLREEVIEIVKGLPCDLEHILMMIDKSPG